MIFEVAEFSSHQDHLDPVPASSQGALPDDSVGEEEARERVVWFFSGSTVSRRKQKAVAGERGLHLNPGMQTVKPLYLTFPGRGPGDNPVHQTLKRNRCCWFPLKISPSVTGLSSVTHSPTLGTFTQDRGQTFNNKAVNFHSSEGQGA